MEALPLRLLASWLYLAIVCLSSAPAIADAPGDSRIARCQDLVRRQSSRADFLSATWRIWEDPVPKKALPALAVTKIKPHDLLYDGGIGGLFRLKAATAPFATRDVFAFCSFDNLFVWLQGIYDVGVWTQFSSTDYVLPY
jgi:hypothetical protein